MPKTDKSSFILYKSYYEILNHLQDNDLGILFRAILAYQATGDILDLPPTLKVAFNFIKNQFDLDDLKYKEFVEKQSANGKKGGRPKKTEKETSEEKNPSLFSKTQKSLNENENENENDNDNENENENDSLSLSDEREKFSDKDSEREINPEDKKLLETYVKRNKLANKNIGAYVRKIISNGDHHEIISQERARQQQKSKSPPNLTQADLDSINDKKSAFKVLAPYCDTLDELPGELEKIAKKYHLETYDELAKYSWELSALKHMQNVV